MDPRSKTGRRALAALAVACVLTVPTAASAVTVVKSWSGSDYSVNSSSGKTITVYDKENDGHAVRTDFYRGNSSTQQHLYNYDGSGTSASATATSLVYQHRVVEIIPAAVDDYGSWVYPK